MKVTCGTDIIEIARIKKAIEDFGDKFLSTIFTENEIHYCEKHKAQKYQHYAARFAAKEAAFKAIGTQIVEQYTWQSFEVINGQNGKPQIDVTCEVTSLECMDISISHCKEYAVATVIAQFEK